jgi:hypothetical protein
VNVKYKIKNNNTDENPVFLAIINQMNTNISSSRNLAETATRLCMVWLSASLDCPLKKMIMVKTARIKNTEEQIAISEKWRLVMNFEKIKYPKRRIMISRIRRKKIFLIMGFNGQLFFNKISDHKINGCKNSEKGEDNCKNGSLPAYNLIKLDSPPGSDKDYAHHLECYSGIPGKIPDTFI